MAHTRVSVYRLQRFSLNRVSKASSVWPIVFTRHAVKAATAIFVWSVGVKLDMKGGRFASFENGTNNSAQTALVKPYHRLGVFDLP